MTCSFVTMHTCSYQVNLILSVTTKKTHRVMTNLGIQLLPHLTVYDIQNELLKLSFESCGNVALN